MEAPLSVIPASPQKRPHADDVEPTVSTPDRSIPSTTSTPLTVMSIATPSPLKQTKIEATAQASSIDAASTNTQSAQASSSTPQPAKRRKLTPKEKEEQAKEKEAKAKERADKKAQKEVEDKLKAEQKAADDKLKTEQKAAKDEEKRKKDEERQEKKRARELKQQQEAEAKQKKERSQLKLGSFFGKAKVAAECTGNTTVDPVQKPSIGQTSSSTDAVVTAADAPPPSPKKAIMQNAQSDYERVFLPFSLPPTAILAPPNALLSTPEELTAAQSRLDNIITNTDVDMEPITFESLRSILPKRRRGLATITMAEIVDRVNGSADNPIDLTEDPNMKPLDLLKQVPTKYLHFGEDVRPPYFGTYTKIHDPDQERKVARNPIYRGLTDLNYDYDSEAEWEEPGEGEDLDSDGEESEEDGEEDMDGFLDDDDDPDMRRRLLNGDQEPVSTGLCWEDASGVSRLNDGSGAISTEFKEFRMGFLLPTQQPIDPFSNAYWAPEIPAARSTAQGDKSKGAMDPPRLPLTSRPVNGLLNTLNGVQKSSPAHDAKTGKPKRTVPIELLPEFKAEVDGSDLTKLGLVEALKKKFSKVPKDAITNTLADIAQRVGPTAAEKRWVLKP